MIKVRQLTKDDIGSFRRVRLTGLQESPTAFGASYAQEERMPAEEMATRLAGTADRWVLGVFAEEELTGVIGFVRETGDKSRHKGFIWGLYVIPEFRGVGMGRALFAATLVRIDALPGFRNVRLSVVTSNHGALRLYEKFGFVRYGEEVDALYVNGVFHSEFHMARRTPTEPNPTLAKAPRSRVPH
ncbi:MAG: N-acetyltransferase [Opitutaceae bacterium]